MHTDTRSLLANYYPVACCTSWVVSAPYGCLLKMCVLYLLKGELEESMAELEESRRKLVNLKMQKDVASVVHTPVQGAVNGSLSPEKHADRTMGFRELKDSVEETKVFGSELALSLSFSLTLTHS